MTTAAAVARPTLRRVGQALAVVLLAYTLTFLLLSLIPINAIEVRLKTVDPTVSPDDVAAAVAAYGLDQPVFVQYLQRLWSLLTGDLGISFAQGMPVADVMVRALGPTAVLTATALVIGVLFALGLALLATRPRLTWVRALFAALPSGIASVPAFVLGIAFLQVFAVQLGLVPVIDDGSFGAAIAPAAILGIWLAAPMTQVLIRAIEEARTAPHVQVAKTRGIRSARLYFSHVLRNSTVPWLTMIGVLTGELIAGGIVTEMVFSRDGIGRVTQIAVLGLDVPVLLAVVLLVATVYVVVNIVIDIVNTAITARGATA